MDRSPQELIADILGNLEHDAASLKACSLISSAWVTPSRQLLFRNVTLGPRHFGEDKQATLNIFDAIHILQTTIVDLTISAGKPRDKEPAYPPRLAIDPEFLVALLRKMPRLQTVTIERCAVEPKADMASTLLPHCWDHEHLRVLRIAPSYQVAHLVDIFRTMLFFRRVPIDFFEFRRDYDARGYTSSSSGKYVPSHLYEMLRDWRVGIFCPNESIRIPAMPSEEENMKLAFCLISAGATNTVQLSNWGMPLLKSLWFVPGREKVRHFKLEVVARPVVHGRVLPEDWILYARFASAESVTFVFKEEVLLERFSKVLVEDALGNLPQSTRIIGFEVQIDPRDTVAPYVMLRWWANKMNWVDISHSLERFTALESLRFGVMVLGDIGWRAMAALDDDMKAIVCGSILNSGIADKLQFVRTAA